MALIQDGSNTTGIANVTSTYDLQVRTPTDIDNAGFVTLASQNDDGLVSGAPMRLAPETGDDFRLRVGLDQTMFTLSFEGTTVAQGHIQQNLSVMTAAQAAGFLALNNGLATANGNAAHIRTYRTFPLFGSYPTYAEFWIREGNPTSTNSVSEWGFGYVSGATAAPTDGVMFRRIAGGQLYAVLNFAGSEPSNVLIDTTNIPPRDGAGTFDATECNHYVVAATNDVVRYWINDTLVASIKVPSNAGSPTQSSAQPLFARVYNSGVASAARQVSIGFLNVSLGDINAGKPWSHVMAGGGGGAYQTQPGNTSGQTANWTNSAAPASATLSNTAAGYTTLGGQWQFAASATNETDWALFGYTNPAGTATLPGKTLYVTSIRVGETHVTGAAGVNATFFYWFAAAGSTAVSLATADSAAVVGPRRVALGGQAFLAAAPIGTQSPGFNVDFNGAPLVVPPGCFLHVGVKQLNGAATASLVWRGTVTVVGYFE